MRVLIIEDEAKTANYLSKGLLEQGYVAGFCQQWSRRVAFGHVRLVCPLRN